MGRHDGNSGGPVPVHLKLSQSNGGVSGTVIMGKDTRRTKTNVLDCCRMKPVQEVPLVQPDKAVAEVLRAINIGLLGKR